ncbi:hypothetical protein GCM10009069_15930 [Algimonas arctica]|uniref:UrcA family protein n=1 Tax=Algimonas arctica TaxID=1479486 RepID=A0A8J3CSE0_9PROT|nr:UrcA family protein [Algimonas arctica]GHA93658.1 hypothetical protein GCM10009069_15930 [Algimonas arctica]
MLTKRKTSMTPRVVRVNKIAKASLGLLALATTAMAPSAFADDRNLMDRTVTVKFDKSDLLSPKGVDGVYAKLVKTAKRSCKSDPVSVLYLGQSMKECADDLVAQFVANADFDVLTRYHLAAVPTQERVQLAQSDVSVATP